MMNHNLTRIILLAVFTLCILLAGCSLFRFNGSDTDVSAIPESLQKPTGTAHINFKLLLPGSQPDRIIPQIRGAITLTVTAELTMARPGIGGSIKFLRIATVDETGTAHLDFAGLPALPALGRIMINDGHIQGWSLFHGAMDLKDGDNLFDLAPEGSKLTPDLSATAMRALFETPELITSAPSALVGLILNAIDQTINPIAPSATSEIFNRVMEAIQPSSLTKLTTSTDKKSLLAEKNSAQVWNLSIQQIFAQQTELASVIANAEIAAIFRHPVSTQPGLAGFTTNSDDWQILAAIAADTGLCSSYIRVQGVITQILMLNDGTTLVGGYDKIANCPFLARWPSGQTVTISSSSTPESGWQSFFTTFSATTAVPQPAVESIMFDGTSMVNVAVRNPNDNLIRIFSISYVDGSGAGLPLNPTVTPNRFPYVELIAPTANSVVNIGVPLTITASATDLDIGDSIASVTFFAGTTKIGEVTSPPYSISWEPPGVATYSLTARAADTRGAIGISAPISLAVKDAARILTQTELLCSVIYPSEQTISQVTTGGQSLVQKSITDHGTGYKLAVFGSAAPVNVTDLVFSDTDKKILIASILASGSTIAFESNFTATASSLYSGDIGKYETFFKVNALLPEPDTDFWYFNHITAKYLTWLLALDSELNVTPGTALSLDMVNMLAGYDDGSSRLATGTWIVKSGSGTLSGSAFTAPATGGSTVLTMTYSEKGISQSTDLVVNTIVNPDLTARNPAINATDVPTDTSITITFNQDMDTTTISTSTFQLKRGTELISGTISYSDARTFVFKPASLLQSSGTQYTVSLTTAIKGSTGVALPAQISWSFTTAGTAVTATSELLITEVGSNFYSNYGAWFEVYNNTGNNLDLSQYTFITTAKQPTSTTSFTWSTLTFSANVILPPRSYGLIVGQSADNMYVPTNVALIPANNGVLPWWYADGFIEIRKNSATIDFVRFGSDSTNPLSTEAWSGSNAPALPGYTAGADENSVIGRSIQRAINLGDVNSGADWTLRGFATPGGMNDVTNDTDADLDGIPDACEQSGATYIGLNVYDWGARAGQKDIFIHINYMNSTHLGLTPNEQALDKVAAAFLNKGYHLHFDTGALFASGQHNLDSTNSHQIPLYEYISLGVETGSKNLYELKAQYLPLARRQFFYYCIFGNKQSNEGSTGLGECPGNDFLLSLGIVNFTSTSYTQLQRDNYLINEQASTLMHELGHNLGLKHGGGEDLNYKPNYVSIMNYLYSSWGLPSLTNSMVGDRYYHMKWSREGYSSASIWKQYFPNSSLSMHNNAWSSDFVMDYSNGTLGSLDENSLSESFGLGNGSLPVDWDGNGSMSSTGLALNINPDYDSVRTQLSDYNDWANINIFFTRSNYGAQGSIRASTTGVQPGDTIVLLDDRQPVPPCNRPPLNCSHQQ